MMLESLLVLLEYISLVGRSRLTFLRFATEDFKRNRQDKMMGQANIVLPVLGQSD
jgi:hypothetical protein